MQNGNRIISLVPLLALESWKSGIMSTDEIVYTETRFWKLDHARGGAKGNQRKQPYGQRPLGRGICVLWTHV